MKLHLLFQYFLFDSALHPAHTRITHSIPSILVPELVGLLVACIRIEGSSEGELQFDSFLISTIILRFVVVEV